MFLLAPHSVRCLISLDAALMEYHCSDDKSVASRIFEKGLDTFGDEIEFVLRYLGFLISINDENSGAFMFLSSFWTYNNFGRCKSLIRTDYRYFSTRASPTIMGTLGSV